MIVSASRRTDLPAFYADWLFSKIEEGFVDVRNPMNAAQVRRVSLRREDVDCFVFWTKDPAPMLPMLSRLAGYDYYFQFTLNGYGRDIEPRVPQLAERIDTLKRLSDEIGPMRVVWRYDPILMMPSYDARFHADTFARIAEELSGRVERVTVSFIDYYRKIAKNWRKLEMREPAPEEVDLIARAIAATAAANGMAPFSCAEKLNLAPYGIMPGACVDPALVEHITGRMQPARRAKSQRPLCGCAESCDIGAYDTCAHGCAYCYANRADLERPFAGMP
jgi:DNA repair photolyase